MTCPAPDDTLRVRISRLGYTTTSLAVLGSARRFTVEIATPYHSTWLDNAKAKFLLGWRPTYDLKRLIDAAWSYRRAPDGTYRANGIEILTTSASRDSRSPNTRP